MKRLLVFVFALALLGSCDKKSNETLTESSKKIDSNSEKIDSLTAKVQELKDIILTINNNNDIGNNDIGRYQHAGGNNIIDTKEGVIYVGEWDFDDEYGYGVARSYWTYSKYFIQDGKLMPSKEGLKKFSKYWNDADPQTRFIK